MSTVANFITQMTQQMTTFQTQYMEASKMASDVKGKSIGSCVSRGAVEGTITQLLTVVKTYQDRSDFATKFLPKLLSLPHIPNIFAYTTNAQRATQFAQFVGQLTTVRWDILQTYSV